jgi:hypothetical protein
LMFNIFQLGCAEWYRYDHDAALVHLKVVKALSDQLGGLSKLSSSLRETILLGDGYLSAEALTVPVFPPHDPVIRQLIPDAVIHGAFLTIE